MTVEQLAEQYAKENKQIYGSDEYAYITDYNNVKEAYIAGYNEAQNTITQCNRSALRGVKWHKVADELPPTDEFISDYVITDKGVAIYNSRLNIWYLHEKHKWVNDIMAWCKIPQFKE